LEIDYKEEQLWLKYGEMEMKGKFINHARNVWDRAVTLLPRVEQFWYKYAYMEELAGAIDLARNVFERWMQWEPEDNAWAAFIKFEERQGEKARARALFNRYTSCIRSPKSYLKYAKWEEEQKQLALARGVFERSLSELNPKIHNLYGVFGAFARFEERCKEHERVRVIYKYAISDGLLDVADLEAVKQELVNFEKRHGSKDSIEDAVSAKRRAAYEEVLSGNQYNYDCWFDYIRMEEGHSEVSGDKEEAFSRVRELYERAVGNVPLVLEKHYWSRYIYLWVNYAVFEEIEAKDMERCRAVYKAVLGLIPHHVFTFTKLWVMAAHFEVRQKDLSAARKLLGQAIGRSGGTKPSVYKRYVELEMQLGEIDRCRKIYEKWLENLPQSCEAWTRFASLEQGVGEAVRARAVFELAIGQDDLDSPSLAWKAYVDFEIAEKERENARALYERLLDINPHVKVWISFALFEAGIDGGGEGDIEKSRDIFARADKHLKEEGLVLERVQLLNTWRDVEVEAGEKGDVGSVNARMPRKLKRRRIATDEAGNALGGAGGTAAWEEYYDYEFPDDEKKAAGLKLMENAMKWKAAMAKKNAEAAEARNEGGGDGKEEQEQEEEEEEVRAPHPVETETLDIDDI
jgi:crooked neck